MNLIKWLFKFSGLTDIVKVMKLVSIIGGLIFAFVVLRSTYLFFADLKLTTKTKTNELYNRIVLLSDSLETSKKQVLIIAKELNHSDSLLNDSNQQLRSALDREKQHQINNYSLSKELNTIRRNGSCFVEEKTWKGLKRVSTWKNVKCDSLRF